MKIRLHFRRGWEQGDYKLESIFGAIVTGLLLISSVSLNNIMLSMLTIILLFVYFLEVELNNKGGLKNGRKTKKR